VRDFGVAVAGAEAHEARRPRLRVLHGRLQRVGEEFIGIGAAEFLELGAQVGM